MSKPSIPYVCLLLSSCMISVSAREPSNCLTDAKVTSLIADFTTNAAEHTDYKGVTKRVLTSDFTSISGSVNFADGIPLHTTMTHSRAELLKQEAKLPSTGAVRDIFVSHTCDTMTWYFEFETTPLPTRAIANLFVNADGKIYKSDREVNSAALLCNCGVMIQQRR